MVSHRVNHNHRVTLTPPWRQVRCNSGATLTELPPHFLGGSLLRCPEGAVDGSVDDKWIEATKMVVYLGYRIGSCNILYKYNINLTHGILGGVIGM
jgi:hypothetical protein